MKPVECPNCLNTEHVQDAYPELPGYWVCVNCGEKWPQDFSRRTTSTQKETQMPKAKQDDLPEMEGEGVSQPRIKELDIAADKYVDVRDKRMAWTEKEVAARTDLVQKMLAHNQTVYRYGDHEVVVKPGSPGVKVRNVDGTSTREEDDA